jgi:hypothetical protein
LAQLPIGLLRRPTPKLAEGKARTGHEATSLAARVRVAADAVGLVGIESRKSAMACRLRE